MVSSYLLLLLVSFYHAQAGWVCPNATLDDSTTRFPPPGNTSYASGLNCTIKIAVRKGQYLDLRFFNVDIEYGDSFTVYDETGTNYNDPTTGKPVDVLTGTNLYIKVVTESTGTLGFQTYFPSITPNAEVDFNVPNCQVLIVDLQSSLYASNRIQSNSSIIITSNTSMAILGDSSLYQLQKRAFMLQGMFIYGGNASNGTFLGSLYSFYNSKKMLTYNQAPYTVTIYSVYGYADACLLFRSAASVQNIDYSFVLHSDDNAGTDSVTVQLNSTEKPTAVTVYNRFSTSMSWGISSLTTNGQVDWLPGATLPPTVPNLSFNSNNDLSRVPVVIPGSLNTFSTSGSSTLILSINSFADLNINDYGYVPSQNYNLPTKDQKYHSTTLQTMVQSNVTFTAINCFNYFTVYAPNGNVFNLTSGSKSIVTDSFSIYYIPAGADNDTGGLMKFEVAAASKAANQKVNAFLSLIIVVFAKVLL